MNSSTFRVSSVKCPMSQFPKMDSSTCKVSIINSPDGNVTCPNNNSSALQDPAISHPAFKYSHCNICLVYCINPLQYSTLFFQILTFDTACCCHWTNDSTPIWLKRRTYPPCSSPSTTRCLRSVSLLSVLWGDSVA